MAFWRVDGSGMFPLMDSMIPRSPTFDINVLLVVSGYIPVYANQALYYTFSVAIMYSWIQSIGYKSAEHCLSPKYHIDGRIAQPRLIIIKLNTDDHGYSSVISHLIITASDLF